MIAPEVASMSRAVSLGLKGGDVHNLQTLLNFHLGLPRPRLRIDGIFGQKTDSRVKEFQQVNRLNTDGIVGPSTRRALLDVRTVTSGATLRPTNQGSGSRVSSSSPSLLPPSPQVQLPTPRLLQPNQPRQAADPPAPPPPAFAITIQAGSQVALNPWFFSPLVVTAQIDILLKNDGRRPFTLSVGGQKAFNSDILNGSPPGAWTGQGFIQLGPNIGIGKVSDSLDLLNPFVQIFIANQPFSLGLALGNQSSWTFARSKDKDGKDVDTLSLILNGQVVTAVDLTNGKATGPPAGQVFLGVAHSF
jgi:peptidoglycan hydrolase-like protein with peptidoglycan-binding domain